ncbi:hypothetical protein Tco_0991075 [Tanacetum coccineum]|uniref:Uncharacterized protein n=1 Tax=Tanacetum coccineum TaxID=301880 RepID=A0ABQ5EYA0_9ASTR
MVKGQGGLIPRQVLGKRKGSESEPSRMGKGRFLISTREGAKEKRGEDLKERERAGERGKTNGTVRGERAGPLYPAKQPVSKAATDPVVWSRRASLPSPRSWSSFLRTEVYVGTPSEERKSLDLLGEEALLQQPRNKSNCGHAALVRLCEGLAKFEASRMTQLELLQHWLLTVVSEVRAGEWLMSLRPLRTGEDSAILSQAMLRIARFLGLEGGAESWDRTPTQEGMVEGSGWEGGRYGTGKWNGGRKVEEGGKGTLNYHADREEGRNGRRGKGSLIIGPLPPFENKQSKNAERSFLEASKKEAFKMEAPIEKDSR